MYAAPETEVLELRLEGVIATSDPADGNGENLDGGWGGQADSGGSWCEAGGFRRGFHGLGRGFLGLGRGRRCRRYIGVYLRRHFEPFLRPEVQPSVPPATLQR